ncbi:hypothetical protein TNCV_3805081 [Trichonephila clavipes]|nr:hypothetical protein TNCV_3805081 [Trichonephila clavipes]
MLDSVSGTIGFTRSMIPGISRTRAASDIRAMKSSLESSPHKNYEWRSEHPVAVLVTPVLEKIENLRHSVVYSSSSTSTMSDDLFHEVDDVTAEKFSDPALVY